MKVSGRDQRPSDQRAFLNWLGVMNVRPTVVCQLSVSDRKDREGTSGKRAEDEKGLTAYQCICRDRRYTRGTDQGSECDGGREDGAQKQRGDDMHGDDGVARLLVLGHLGDPAGEWQYTVARYSPDQAGAGHTGYGGVLEIVSGLRLPNISKLLTKIRPRTQITTMNTCPPLPSTKAYRLTKGCGAASL